jgi:hypothetical protein
MHKCKSIDGGTSSSSWFLDYFLNCLSGTTGEIWGRRAWERKRDGGEERKAVAGGDRGLLVFLFLPLLSCIFV